MTGLTAQQDRVLGLIRQQIATTGQSPTVRELCQGLGVSSTCTVLRHLERLEAKGRLTRMPRLHRGIRLVGDPATPLYADLVAENERLRAAVAEAWGVVDQLRGTHR